jgi:hypothetical protein
MFAGLLALFSLLCMLAVLSLLCFAFHVLLCLLYFDCVAIKVLYKIAKGGFQMEKKAVNFSFLSVICDSSK